MPRNTNKGRTKRNQSTKAPDGPPDENDDCSSDITQLSMDDLDNQSVYAESITGGETVTVDSIDEKIKDALDNITHKNVSIRVEALKILQAALTANFVPGLLTNWKVTAADAVERCMRKKSGEECRRAINLGVLLALQLGDEFNDLVTKFSTILKEWIADWTLSMDFRAECANAFSLYTFLTTDDVEKTAGALNVLHDVWTRIKINSPPEFCTVYCSCLNAWSLMLLNLPDRYVDNALNNDLPLLCDHLENSQMDVRIASGEALCILYELANHLPAYEEVWFRPATHERTLELLEQMSRESVKYQAKRDRRLQRASFRDIHAAIKDNDVPEIKVKFGSEYLVLDSWSLKLCYNMLCSYLRGGINVHLRQNLTIRHKLGLGAPMLEGVAHKATKLERQIFNQSVNKARSLARGKQRDKRVANL